MMDGRHRSPSHLGILALDKEREERIGSPEMCNQGGICREGRLRRLGAERARNKNDAYAHEDGRDGESSWGHRTLWGLCRRLIGRGCFRVCECEVYQAN